MATYGVKGCYVGDVVDSIAGLSAANLQQLTLIQELDIKPKTNTDKAYAGNRVVDTAAQFEQADISFKHYDLTRAQEAFLLTKSQPSGGGMVSAVEDEGKYKCILYQSPLRRINAATGLYVQRYGYIYKVRFVPFDTAMKGIEGKPDLTQVPLLTGAANGTIYSYVDEMGRTIHPWEYHIDDDDPNFSAGIATTWMNGLLVPTYDHTALTVTSVPVNGATGVADNAAIVFTFNKAVNPACVTGANFILFRQSTGAAVSFTLSIDGTGKIVTMTPTSPLATGAVFIAVAGTGISDNFGNTLAAADIVSFTAA